MFWSDFFLEENKLEAVSEKHWAIEKKMVCFLLVAMVLLSALTSTHVQGAVSSGAVDQWGKHFVTSSRCPGRVLSPVHSYFTGVVRSALQCVTLCARNLSCLSAVHDPQKSSCRLGLQAARLDCANMEAASLASKHFEPSPACTGEFQTLGPAGTCVCIDGYRDKPCTPYIGDCTEAYNRGLYNDTMVLEVYPLLAQQPFRVNCKMKSNVRTYIMDHNSDTLLNFNRSFSDYQLGFGDLSADHWLGLEKVYQLTNSKTYELRVTATLQNKTTIFQQYQEFNISDAASGYRLYFNRNVSTYLLGDCFTPLLGAPFSAHDNDNDGDVSVNCALKHAAGFWFAGRNCTTCNPMGPLPQPASGLRLGVPNEAFWTNNLGKAAVFRLNMFLVVL